MDWAGGSRSAYLDRYMGLQGAAMSCLPALCTDLQTLNASGICHGLPRRLFYC